jgi:two-component SAPR family response regulator
MIPDDDGLKTILVIKVTSSRCNFHWRRSQTRTGELKPDLILIDLKLNGAMSGVEAADKIRDLHDVPIIFLTVFIKNCLNKSLGVPEDSIVLSKPIMQEHLEYGISRAFQAINKSS